MKNLVALAVLVICVASCYGIQWKDCGSKLSKVKNVMVTGCELKVCNLPLGANVTFTVDFITNAGATDAKSVVHGIIDKIPLPFPFDHPDACKDKQCGLLCPLKASKSYTYHPIIHVKKDFPKVKVVVKWELQASDGSDIFCIEVPAEIVDPKKTTHQDVAKPNFSNKMPKDLLSNFGKKLPKYIRDLPISNKLPKSDQYLRFSNKMPKYGQYLRFSKEMFKRN